MFPLWSPRRPLLRDISLCHDQGGMSALQFEFFFIQMNGFLLFSMVGRADTIHQAQAERKHTTVQRGEVRLQLTLKMPRTRYSGFLPGSFLLMYPPLLLLSLQHFLWRTLIFTKRLQIWVWTYCRPLLSIDYWVKKKTKLHHLVPVWRIMGRALICLDTHTALKGCQVQLVSFPRAETVRREDTILIKTPGTGLAR